MGKKDERNVILKNRKAEFEYHFIHKFEAGLILTGAEVKSVKNAKASISEAYCFVNNEEIFIKGMHISEFKNLGYAKHEPLRDKKLLLNKREIKKIINKLKDEGVTLIPILLFISDRGFIKIEIAIAKGKKLYDKRADLKEKDIKRDLKTIEY